MDIEFLKHYDFPDTYIQTLQKAFGKTFLPLQEMGIKQGKLFEGNHLLVQAPTSSGKTMLAELLFLHHVRVPRSTLLLVPTKALANQRYHELKKRYQKLGLKICLSTRDHPYHDGNIRRGDFHLAVLVYEKLLSLLIDSPTLLSYTGACVMDEMHYVLDPKRGCDIDLLLTRIMQETHIQRMGLSAIQLDDSICDWMGLERLELNQRPVELRQGVLCQGKFHYREFNTNECGVEELPLDETVDDGSAMLEAAEFFYHRGESTLLFFPTRDLCYTAARKFAGMIHPDTLLETHSLHSLEDSSVKKFLSTLIPKQIAIHTSDLTTHEREVVETLIQQNKVRVIFATSTLAEGINFPVTNVITTKHMYTKPVSAAHANSPPVQMPLSYDRLQNMTGRAGRLGYQEYGRGMIVSCYSGEIDGLINQFTPQNQLQNCKNTHPVLSATLLLRMFSLFQPQDETQLISLMDQTFYFSKPEGATSLHTSICTLIEQMQESGFLIKQHGQLCLTRKAEITMSQGISTATAHELSNYAHQITANNHLNIYHLLFITAMCGELEEMYIPVTLSEIKFHTWTRSFFEHCKHTPVACDRLSSLLQSASELNKNHHRACKKVMLCLDWMNGVTMIDLEQKYRVYSGFIVRLTSEVAWLIQSVTHFVSANQLEPQEDLELQLLLKRLLYGVPTDSLLWCERIQTHVLNRQQVLALIQHGFTCPTKLAVDDESLLNTILPQKIVHKLLTQYKNCQSETDQHNVNTLCMDSSRPDRVLIDGKSVQLTKLQSKLLECLQEKANHCVLYDRIMNTLWGDGLGDRKGLNRLKNQITQKCVSVGGASYQNMIEVVPGTGFILRATLRK